MSAGQHEAVQVDVNPSEFVEEDDLAGDESRAPSAESSSTSRRSSIREMLSSTEPSESPEMQDGTLSTGAKWHQHLELAIKKATGASGTPAWINGIMAAFLLVADGTGVELPGASNESGGSPGIEDEPEGMTQAEGSSEISVVGEGV